MRADQSGLHRLLESHKTLTINHGVAEAVTEDLFILTGIIKIHDILGEVVNAALAAGGVTACQLALKASSGMEVLTKVAGAPAITGFGVGSILHKHADKSQILDVEQNNTPMILEADVALQRIPFKFIIGKDVATTTTLQFLYTAGADLNAETGAILWHVQWSPFSDDGLFIAA